MGRNAQRRRVNGGGDWVDRLRQQRQQQQASGVIATPGGGPKPPFCPMLSSFVAVGASPIQIPGGRQANSINMELVRVPCALGKDCMLFDAEWECCGLVSQLQMLSELYGDEGDNDGEQIPDDGPQAGGALPAGHPAGGGGAALPPESPSGG